MVCRDDMVRIEMTTTNDHDIPPYIRGVCRGVMVNYPRRAPNRPHPYLLGTPSFVWGSEKRVWRV